MENIENFPQNLISFFTSLPLDYWFLILRIVFIALSLILIGFVIFFLSKSSWLKFRFLYDLVELFTYQPFGTRKTEKEWKKIKTRLDTGLESEYKLAVIEADNMFNEILKEMRYEGESLGERLDNMTTAVLPNIDQVKKVHKTRNNIIHDPNYKLSLEEAKEVLDVFEEALKGFDLFGG